MWRSRTLACALALTTVVVGGCSLSYDFSRFHVAEEDAGAHDARVPEDAPAPDGSVDAARPDAAADAAVLDGATEDAASTMDAGGDDAAVSDDAGRDASATDAAVLDAGRDASARDAGGADAGTAPSCHSAIGGATHIDLGDIVGLPAPIQNTRYAVAGTATGDLAVAWLDAAGTLHFESFHVDVAGGSATPDVTAASVSTGHGSGASIDLARAGNAWVVLATSPTRWFRCTDGGSCTVIGGPSNVSSPYALAYHSTDYALVHVASASFVWQYTFLPGGAPMTLTDSSNGFIPIDVAAREGDGYVALVTGQRLSTVSATFGFFTASGTSTVRSAVTDPVSSLQVTYDAATQTAVGLAASLSGPGAATHLLTAQSTSATATEVAQWDGTPRPLVSRGDGTFFVYDGTSYGLRAITAPAANIDQPGDPGAIGLPVIVSNAYAYLAVYDMTTDAMELVVYGCR